MSYEIFRLFSPWNSIRRYFAPHCFTGVPKRRAVGRSENLGLQIVIRRRVCFYSCQNRGGGATFLLQSFYGLAPLPPNSDGPDPCPNDAEHSSFIQMMRCANIFGAYWPENSVQSVIKESTNRVFQPSSCIAWLPCFLKDFHINYCFLKYKGELLIEFLLQKSNCWCRNSGNVKKHVLVKTLKKAPCVFS